MFGTRLLDRRSRPERITSQAWEQLVAAVNSGGDAVRHTTRGTARSARRTTAHLADGASDRAGEAWTRASRAYDALAGRQPSRPWGWLVGAGLVGIALGWAAGMVATRARQQADVAELTTGSAPFSDDSTTVIARSRDDESTQNLEFVDMDQPTQPISRDF